MVCFSTHSNFNTVRNTNKCGLIVNLFRKSARKINKIPYIHMFKLTYKIIICEIPIILIIFGLVKMFRLTVHI